MYIHVYIIIYVYVGLYVNFTINVERKFFCFFFNKWDDAPLGDGSLHKLCTLRIGRKVKKNSIYLTIYNFFINVMLAEITTKTTIILIIKHIINTKLLNGGVNVQP